MAHTVDYYKKRIKTIDGMFRNNLVNPSELITYQEMKRRYAEKLVSIGDKTYGCGVYPFITGKNDPFLKACIQHDIDYEEKKQGIDTETFNEISDRFEQDVDSIAKSLNKKVRATIYKWLATGALGGFLWYL